jgi:very-long-chain enoyl-CoA reductase
VQFKDLGPQVSYRGVFLVEYAGPIAFMVAYASRPSFIYGYVPQPLGRIQTMFVVLFLAHFVKREFETLFVHKFSRPTMPLRNLFKNCAYYWSFAAVIGYFLCHPQYVPPTHGLEHYAALSMVVFEVGNFLVHWQLSTMRRGDGDSTRNIPSGPLFALVSCPNYTFEFLSWVAFSVGTNVVASWVFTFLGLAQMTDWALKKHRGYVKADPTNKGKASILPFVI